MGFHFFPQLLPWPERHDATGRNRNPFSGFGITTGTLAFDPQDEIAKSRKLDVFTCFERLAYFFKKKIDQFLGFTLVQAKGFMQCHRQFCFCDRRHTLRLSIVRPDGLQDAP